MFEVCSLPRHFSSALCCAVMRSSALALVVLMRAPRALPLISPTQARMTEGGMLKKITEAMKDLVTEANFDCSTTGISLQAMVTPCCPILSLAHLKPLGPPYLAHISWASLSRALSLVDSLLLAHSFIPTRLRRTRATCRSWLCCFARTASTTSVAIGTSRWASISRRWGRCSSAATTTTSSHSRLMIRLT